MCSYMWHVTHVRFAGYTGKINFRWFGRFYTWSFCPKWSLSFFFIYERYHLIVLGRFLTTSERWSFYITLILLTLHSTRYCRTGSPLVAPIRNLSVENQRRARVHGESWHKMLQIGAPPPDRPQIVQLGFGVGALSALLGSVLAGGGGVEEYMHAG